MELLESVALAVIKKTRAELMKVSRMMVMEMEAWIIMSHKS
jgi:hypothetical protein